MHVKKSELVCIQLIWILLTMNHYVNSRWPRTWALACWLKPVRSFPILRISASDSSDDWLLSKRKPGPYLLCSTRVSIALGNNMAPSLSVSSHPCIFWTLHNVNWAWKRWKEDSLVFHEKRFDGRKKAHTEVPVLLPFWIKTLTTWSSHFLWGSRHKQDISKIRRHISPLLSREYWGSGRKDCTKKGSEGGKGQRGGENYFH